MKKAAKKTIEPKKDTKCVKLNPFSDEPKKDTKRKELKFQRFKRGIFDMRYWKSRWAKYNAPSKQMFIMMELRSGKWDMFFIDSGKESFVYKGGEYVIDVDSYFYSSALGMFCLKYHQDLSIPVRQNIPVKEIDKAIQASKTLDIENATNPSVVRSFIVSDVIKDVIQSSGIHTYLKAMRLVVIISLIVCILHFLAYLMKSGIIKEMTGALGL